MMTGQHTAAPANPSEIPAVDSEEDYKSAWKEYDPSLKSSITAGQFRQLMAGLGENVTDAEVDELVNSVDGDDKISCEFLNYILHAAVKRTVADVLL
jgi:calmodulin